MVMKKSTKRGYMTLSEIKAKLKKLYANSPTKDEVWDFNPRRLDQIDYLQEVIKNKKVLAPETLRRVYHILDGLLAQEVRAEKWQYVKSGFDLSKTYHLDHASEEIDTRGRLAEDQGDYPRAIKLYEKALSLNERAQRMGSGSWTPVHSKAEIEALKKKYGQIPLTERLASAFRGAFIIGTIAGALFLSPGLTGNAIAELPSATTSIIGAGLLILGVTCGFFWVNNRKK